MPYIWTNTAYRKYFCNITIYYSTGKSKRLFSQLAFQSVILLQYSHAELITLLILLSAIKLINYTTQ
jgi:hypothetical protein